MSSTSQITLSGEREEQWSRFIQTRPDLQNLGMTEAIRKVLFDEMDKAVPLPKKD